MSDAEFGYVSGQARPGFVALLAAFEAESAAERGRGDARIDIAYGAHPRQRLDWFPAAGAARGTIAYFHAGYWQSRDKAQFGFIAPGFNRAGLNVAVVNYPLCPEASVAGLVAAAAESVSVAEALGAGRPLVLAGHSAGGQIAVELAMRCAGIAGVAAISGVFDLRPLIATSLNAKLGLDAATAEAASPVLRAVPGSPPAIFAVGGAETEAFRAQNAAMAAAWTAAGNAARVSVIDGADHFSVLRALAGAHPLHRAAIALAGASA